MAAPAKRESLGFSRGECQRSDADYSEQDAGVSRLISGVASGMITTNF